MDPYITIAGNLAADADLRYTPAGAPVANFTVAHTHRTFDKQRGEWVEGEPMFLNCTVWRDAAEHAAESLRKGMRVIVWGKLKSRSYEAKDGSRRTVFEIEVEEVGPSLRFATATVQRAQRGQQASFQQPAQRPPQADPWAQPQSDEPPF